MIMYYLDFGKDTVKVCAECVTEKDNGLPFFPWHDRCSKCGKVFES